MTRYLSVYDRSSVKLPAVSESQGYRQHQLFLLNLSMPFHLCDASFSHAAERVIRLRMGEDVIHSTFGCTRYMKYHDIHQQHHHRHHHHQYHHRRRERNNDVERRRRRQVGGHKSPAVDGDVHLIQVPAARAHEENRQLRAIGQPVVLARVGADVRDVATSGITKVHLTLDLCSFLIIYFDVHSCVSRTWMDAFGRIRVTHPTCDDCVSFFLCSSCGNIYDIMTARTTILILVAAADG